MNKIYTLLTLISAFFTLTSQAQLTAQFSASDTSSCGPIYISFTDISAGSPVSWYWDFGDGNTSTLQHPSNLFYTPGNYTISLVVSDSINIDSASINITINAIPQATLSATNTTCGNCTGSISTTITTGTSPFTYLWNDPSNQTGSTASNLCAGTYNVIITDSNLCSDTSFAVVSSTGAFTVSSSAFDATCFGSCDGAATVTPIGGTSPFTFIWPTGDLTSTVVGLCAGTYIVSISDNSGCTVNETIIINEPTPLNANLSGTPASCGGCLDGTLTATAVGGTPPYSYMWDANAANQTTATAVGLGVGSYCLDITDANGCIFSICDSVTSCGSMTAILNTNSTLCGQCNGYAHVQGINGNWPYTFIWSNGFTGPEDSTLCSGNYSITLTDNMGCTLDTNFTINASGNIALNLTVSPTACGQCNGSASVAPSGGTTPYSFAWSNGENTSTIDSLCSGNYSVTVYDANACNADTSFALNNSSGLSGTITTTDATCQGVNDGTATITPLGGTAPYIYLWSNGQTTATAVGLIAGTYSVTLTDSTNCSYITSATINEPPALVANYSVTNPGCMATTGSILFTATGGTAPYLYSIDGGSSWSSNTLFDSLAIATYIVGVQDTNGCQTQDTLLVDSTNNSLTLTATIYPEWYCGGGGYININVSGGVFPYTYQWDSAASAFWNWGSWLSADPGTYSVIVTDANGCSATSTHTISTVCAPNLVSGNVFNDESGNCINDGFDYPLQGWTVQANPGGQTAITNSQGNYSFNLDSGNYTISVVDQDSLRDVVCPPPGNYNISLGSSPSNIDTLDFAVQPSVFCPQMWVYISAWNIRPCFDRNIYVYYKNTGTVTATNVTVDVEIPSDVTFNSSTATLLAQNGNVLTFDLGDVTPSASNGWWYTNYFSINVTLDCDPNLLGSTRCFEAHIYPDDPCFSPDSTWDKSSVAVEGRCDNDSLACFTIYNTGDPINGDMQGPSEYRIYENNILVSTGTFQIAGGDSTEICWPSAGNTIRLEADQRPGHPGYSQPQDNVELCGNPNQVTGVVTQTPLGDDDDFIDIACLIVTNSYDPNDKAVQPTGITSQYHFIEATDQLEYKIRFQNTGNDTAYKVVIADTISSHLDITTLQSGASSHAYTFELHNDNVAVWTFDNIYLPDSNINEPASHGFVQFRIDQKEGNPLGTVIENTAGIYFDFNDPVITNTTFNTIGNMDSLTTSTPVVYRENIEVGVYPNPFNYSTNFVVSGKTTQYTLDIFDVVGKKVRSAQLENGSYLLHRNSMNSGIYFYTITSKSGLASSGKLIIK